MRLVKKIALTLVVVVPLLLIIGITLTIGWRPFIGARSRPVTDRKFEVTPARLERGEYLVNGLLLCMHCHSEHGIDQPGAPPKKEPSGRLLVSDPDLGTLYSANITPDLETGIGAWTDDEVARAIREGISKDGHALFPIMPYENFRKLSDDDLAAVIVYIRSLPPVRHAVPTPQINFPLNRLVLGAPEPLTDPVRDPAFPTPRDRGAHLVDLANCDGCHTARDGRGQKIAGLEFAGGVPIPDFTGKQVSSLNLTPDPTGIPYYDEATFIKTIRTGQIGARKLNPAMPWSTYRNLNDDDLKAIFAFIHTLKPVVHKIDNSLEPTMCPLCGNAHGRGNTNKR